MHQTTVISAGLIGLAVATASAADLPYRTLPPLEPPAPAFTWTGFYIGGYAGGSWGTLKSLNLANGQQLLIDPSGAAAGGLAGYNLQFGAGVAGVEVDGGWSGAKANSPFTTVNGATDKWATESSYVARGRGRLGYAMNNVLLFGAGGASVTDDKVTFSPFAGPPGAFSITKTLTGWNLGGGVDWSFAPNWIGRVEYIHDEYDKKFYGFNALSAGFFANKSISVQANTVRAGLMYKFW